MKNQNRSKNDFYDDNRVIADMNIDGMPASIFRRKPFRGQKNGGNEEVRLTKEEKRTIIKGIASSYIVFTVLFFGLLALFILFCMKIWLK